MAQKFIVPITIKQLASASSDALTVSIDGDSYGRVKIEAGGRLSWGDGGGTFDTNLYRDSANTLATDDVLKAIAGVVTLTTNGAPTASLPNGTLAVDTTNNVFYFRSNSTWTQVSADGGASVTVSDTAPVSPEVGDLWFDSSVLELYIYYSSAWVELTLNGAEDISDLYDVNITSPTSGQVLEYDGLEWINSTLVKSDVGLGNVDNTSDVNKPVSTAGQTALNLKANLASPTFTGTPTLPTGTIAVTQTVADNSTKVATTAFVRGEVTALVNSATSTLDTLGEIATALGNDANLSATLTTSIGLKAPLASPTFTGTVTIPTGASITAPTGLVKGDVGLGNVDNTSNATERAATATLTNKTLTSPVINTPTGIVKGDVGLGLVDNTADTAKPVSTAQQTALDLKANLASPTFTGTVTVPTPTNNTDAATKAYTDAIVTAAKIITAAGGDGTNGQALTTNGAGTLDFTTIVGTTEASIITAVGADGAAGSVLKTNGSGDLSFGDVALGTNTSGSYVASLVAGTGVTLTNNSGEGATPTVAIGQAVATNSNVTFNDLTVSGNLTVSGTTTSINTETLTINDNIIVINNNATGSPTENAGIEVERGTSANVLIRWNETSDKWEFTNDGSTYSILGTGGATVSDTAPASPITGDFWFESDTGKTFIYYDSQWVEVGPQPNTGASALTTKGDLLSRDASTFARLAVGTNGYFLKADSSATTGLTWSAIPTINNLDDVGDVTITSAANGDLLKWNGTAWVNAAGYALLASPTFTGTVVLPDNTVALGTKTTGDYVATITGGTGVTSTAATTGEGTTHTLSIGQAVATNSNVTFNDLTVSGNLTVSGTTTSINTETLTINDNIIVLNNNATSTPTENAGIEVERGTSTNVLIRWNETNDKWEFTNDGTTYSNLGAGGATVSSNAPASPTEGQIWFDNDTAKTFVYYDSSWIEIGAGSGITSVTVSSSAPASPAEGYMWFDSDTGGTYIYYGTNWIEVGVAPLNAVLNTYDAKGDIVVATADNTIARLAVGSANQVLTVDSTTATGLKWATPTTYQAVVVNVSDTEIGYLDGVTSAIQTQLNNKQAVVANVSDTEIGYLDGVTSAIQTQLNNKQAVVANVSDTEIGYLDGVTSAIQTQLNTKASTGKSIAMSLIFGGG